MHKITASVTALILLSSCSHHIIKTDKEIEEGYRNDYVSYSCPQLHQKYAEIKTHNEQERQSRHTMNAVNTAVGVFGMINGRGTVGYNSESPAEKNNRLEIKAIEKLAIDKECECVSFK